MIIINLINNKLEKIKSSIFENKDSYELSKIEELISKLEIDIKFCIKVDKDYLNFFSNKKQFRTLTDLKFFSTTQLRYNVKSSKRADIEEELAKVASYQQLNKSEIFKLSTKKSEPKRKIQEKIEIKDQATRWLIMDLDNLKKELNDTSKYPNINSLKQAANSILNANEKRLRTRDKILKIIIERISEDKAITKLGS